jgi:hypothetical protein
LNNIKPSRKNILIEQLVLVDGQPGCGKAALDPAIASMERVELLNLSPQIENICGLKHLGKIDDDSSEAMIKLELDLVLYETMMGRNTNFRISDQSSAFNDINYLVYLKRLFQKGDKFIPEIIKNKKPILHFMTHSMLAFSIPLFNCYKEKMNLIEIVRHPKSMIAQQTAYNESWLTDEGKKRQFQLFFDYEGEEVPFWAKGWEKLYINSNPVERAIYEMANQIKLTNTFKEKNKFLYDSQCFSIPFEKFVVDPWPFLKKISDMLKTNKGRKTLDKLKKENVPRSPIINSNDEIKNYLKEKNASKKSITLLDSISNEYEETHLKL